ncbi:MAG: tetratricopeptide repeat protein [Bacteroidota bacterium]
MSKRKVTQQQSPTPIQLPSWWTNALLHSVLIFLFSSLLYVNTISHEYTQDDAIVLYDNMFTTQGFEGIGGLLTKDTFFGFFKVEGKANLVAGGRYRPLTLIQFAIGWQFFENQPWIYHLMNIFWYALTCLMVYWLLLRMLNRYSSKIYIYFIALGTALLFAAHPVHVEAVANIKGRDEIMTLLGSLAALYFALRAFDEKKAWMYILSAGLFFLGILAKENAITFLAVVPLSFFVFRRISVVESLTKSIPLFVAAGIYLVLRFSILGFDFGEPSRELMNNPYLKIENGQWVDFTFAEWSATIIFTLGKYLQLLAFPHPLTHDYYPRQVDIMNWGNWQVLLSFAAYVGMTIYALIRLPKRDPVSYGILYFIITLSIVSNIVFPIGTNMGERFIFVPSLGFCFVAMVLLWRLAKKINAQKITQLSNLKLSLGITAIIVLLFSAKTFTRNFIWKDNFTLFTTDIYTSPNSGKLRNAMGGTLLDQASKETDETKRSELIQEAKGHLQEAIQIHPTYKNAYLLLGNANNYSQDYEAAIQYYEQALQLDDSYEEAINNLGITYREAGKYYGMQQNDPVKAIEYLEKARQMTPNDIEVLDLLGTAYGISGQPQKTIEILERAVQINPSRVNTLRNLGAAHGQLGNEAKAQEYLSRAAALEQ